MSDDTLPRRRAADTNIDRELGSIESAIKALSSKIDEHARAGADYREYQAKWNHKIGNDLNTLTLQHGVLGLKLDQLAENQAANTDRIKTLENDSREISGGLKVLKFIGLPVAGAAGWLVNKLTSTWGPTV